MLEPLGVPQRAEDVYRALVKHGPATEARLAELAGLEPTAVMESLADLAELGLARPEPDRAGTWYAESPEVTLAGLVVAHQEALVERQRALDRAQSTVGELMRLSRQRQPGTEGAVELCPDVETARRRCAHLARTAEETVHSLSRLCPPETGDGAGPDDADAGAPDEVGDVAALLARGVEVHTIHERSALLPPGRFEQLRRLVSAGAYIRTLPALPMRVALYDRANAVIRLDDTAAPAAVLVHRSELLDGLVTLFDLLWERAVPIPAAPEDDEERDRATDFDDVLVALLAAGFKDESIARHLGISASTVTRRMSRLMDLTGTSTRFQLGMQAVRRGWI